MECLLMLVNRRKIDIKYPDCSASDLSLAFYDRINFTKDSAIEEINKLTENDDLEIARIQMAIEWYIAKNAQDENFSEFAPFDLSVLKDKEPTIKEIFLSASLHSSYFGEEHFESGNLLKAFNCLAQASEMLGFVQGYKLAENVKDEETLIKKMVLSNKASQARHAENRAMKDQVIQYYKDNREMLGSKEKASYEISQKIVPVSSSTIKGWLKNV